MFSTLMLLKRFSMVPVLSSAASMPLPGATMAWAIDVRSCDGMTVLLRRDSECVGMLRDDYSSAYFSTPAMQAQKIGPQAAQALRCSPTLTIFIVFVPPALPYGSPIVSTMY